MDGYKIVKVINVMLTLQVETFMLMYSSHCQRIFDSVSRRCFDEVNFIAHIYVWLRTCMCMRMYNIIYVYEWTKSHCMCRSKTFWFTFGQGCLLTCCLALKTKYYWISLWSMTLSYIM